MALRLLVLAVLAVGVAVAVVIYRARSTADEELGAVDADGDAWPPVPAELLDGTPRTWLIFTTPMCASCPQVQADLERTFPDDRVVKIDATERTDLVDAYGIRRAPTTLLAAPDGEVMDRLVGPEAVRSLIAG